MVHSSGPLLRTLLASSSAAAVLMVVTVTLLPVHSAVRAAGAPDEVLVVLNGEPLSSAALDTYRSDVHPPSATTSRSNRLVEDIDDVLVIQDGKARGYALTDAQFDSVLDNIRKDNGITGGPRFAQSLQRAHLTVAGIRRRLERQMILSRMRALNGASGTTPTEQSVRRYYLSHADEFSQRSFDQARDLVESRLEALERQEQWAAYIQALESRAVMDWRNPEAQRVYAIGLTERTHMPR
jgi:hypothetical protein